LPPNDRRILPPNDRRIFAAERSADIAAERQREFSGADRSADISRAGGERDGRYFAYCEYFGSSQQYGLA
jgi:hypothetical protein